MMNKMLQQKFTTTEKNLVVLKDLLKNNEDCSYHIRKALEHLADAYDIKGGR